MPGCRGRQTGHVVLQASGEDLEALRLGGGCQAAIACTERETGRIIGLSEKRRGEVDRVHDPKLSLDYKGSRRLPDTTRQRDKRAVVEPAPERANEARVLPGAESAIGTPTMEEAVHLDICDSGDHHEFGGVHDPLQLSGRLVR